MDIDNQNTITDEEIDSDVSELSTNLKKESLLDFAQYSPFRVDFKNKKDFEWENFLEKISVLSDSIKNILSGSDTIDFMILVSEKFDLENDQTAYLSRIIQAVLTGDLFAGDMTQAISEKLEIDPQTAQQIRDKIVKELFAPAIEDIKKIQREKFPDRTKQGTAPQPTQTKTASPVNQSNVIDLRNQT